MTTFFSELCVVIVIYKMKIGDSGAYKSLTKAVKPCESTLFIYDNSPEEQQPPADSCWQVYYFHDPSNPGVSKAYNAAYQKSLELGKKWMLLVDQDTDFPTSVFQEYSRYISPDKRQIVVPLLRDKIGLVSPFKFRLGSGLRLKTLAGGTSLELGEFFFHNSGLLLSVDLFQNSYGYDENLPLDFSDLSFVYRLKRAADFFIVANVVCRHQLATSSKVPARERLTRFKSYISASRYYKAKYAPSNWMLSLRVMLRGVKLSFQYLSFKFIAACFTNHG